MRRILHDPAFRVAAQRMGVEMRRHDAAEEGAELLERLADTGRPVTEPVRPARAR